MAIEIFDAVGRFSSNSAAFGRTITGMASGVQRTSQRLSASFARVSRVALVAGVAIVGTLAATVKVAADFEQSVTNAAVVTGRLGTELAETKVKLGELASELGRTTVFTAREAADALGILARKGFDVAAFSAKDMRPFLDLAAATMSDLTFTTDILTETLKAFGIETSQVGRVADVFAKAAATTALDMNTLGEAMKFVAPIARTAGVSLEETTAALGQLAEQGIKGSIAGTALRRMFVELISPGARLEETLQRMGLTTADVSLRTKSLTQVLSTLKTAGITAGEVMDAFGLRAGPAALALLDVNNAGTKTIDAIDALRRSLEDSGGAAEQMAEEQLKTLSGQLKLFKSALESVAISIGKLLLPVLTEFATTVGGYLRLASEWIENNKKLTSGIVKFAGALGVGLVAIGAASFVIAGLLIGIKLVALAIAAVGAPFVIVAATIALVIGGVLAEIFFFKDQIIGAWRAIQDFFFRWVGDHSELVFEIIDFWEELKIKIPKALKFAFVTAPKKIWEAVKFGFSETFAFLTKTITEALEFYKTEFPRTFNFIKNLIANTWEAIKFTTKVLWAGIKTIVTTAIDGIIGSITFFIDTISKALNLAKQFAGFETQSQVVVTPALQAMIDAGLVAPGGAPVEAQRPGVAGRGDVNTTSNSRTVIVEPGAIQINAAGQDEGMLRRVVNDALQNLERLGEDNFGTLSAMGAS